MIEPTHRQLDCPHLEFNVSVEVVRIENVGRFAADISIACKECRLPFEFYGLPLGCSLDMMMIGLNGELRAPIKPAGSTPGALRGVSGFGIRVTDGPQPYRPRRRPLRLMREGE